MANPRFLPRSRMGGIPAAVPNALSASRILMAPALWSLLASGCPLAFPLYAAACATDLLDGRIARILRCTSVEGSLLDASADFLLLATGFYYYAVSRVVSPLLLIAMTASFAYYVLTVRVTARSLLGKHVGTVLFALLAVTILLPSAKVGAAVSVVGVTFVAASMAARCLKIRADPRRV